MSTGIAELSPLDQIRLVEADIARQLVAAREAGEEKIAKSQTHAEQIIGDARNAGKNEGETSYKNIIVSAEEEAQSIVAEAHHRAAELKHRGTQRMESLTLTAMDIVNGVKGEAQAHEH